MHTLQQGFQTVGNDMKALSADIQMLAADPIRGSLRPVIQARFDHGSSVHARCQQGTREEVLATLCSWLRPDDPRLTTLRKPVAPPRSDHAILWVYALAGAGKSTLALTAAEWWDHDGVLGASFFCARDGDRSDVACVFRTIAYQLACRFPRFRGALADVVRADPDLHASIPSRQLQKLIVEPLQVANAQDAFPDHVVVVIDALDECTDDGAVSTILKSLALHINELAPLKFLITSRPEENIARGFLLQALKEHTQPLPLTEIPEELTKRDISTFIQSSLAEIRARYPSVPSEWPSQRQFDNLLTITDVLFVFAATAVAFIGDDKARDPEGQLTRLLESGNAVATAAGSNSASPFATLDALYSRVLLQASEKLAAALRVNLRLILGAIALAEERLTPATLETLLDLPSGTLRCILPVLSSVVTMPAQGDTSTPIRVIHLSFANFLVDPDRCTEEEFLIHPPVQHSLMALRCFKTMQALKINICEVDPGHEHLLNSEIADLPKKVNLHLHAALQYACKYWGRHLCRAEMDEELLSALEEFCQAHLLHWLEALSLKGCLDVAIEALQSAQIFLKDVDMGATDVPALLYDCERVVRAFFPAIRASFTQVYRTIMIFSPTDSILRQRHAPNFPEMVQLRIGREKTWNTTLASSVVTTRIIMVLVFSPDGVSIACGADDGTIHLLDTHTGVQLQVLLGHTEALSSLSFSPSGKELLSGSRDGQVKLWDIATSACLATWEHHSDAVESVAWTHDGGIAASGSLDGTVVLWKVTSSDTTSVFRHRYGVSCIVFAPDQALLSASYDKTCKVWATGKTVWDATDNVPIRTLSHESSVCAIAVPPDSSLVACGLVSSEIVLWTKSDGQRLRSLFGESGVLSLAFQSNSLLAAAYEKRPFALWDVSKAAQVNQSSNASANAAAFSSDGVHMAHAVGGTLELRHWPVWAPSNLEQKKTSKRSLLPNKLKGRLGSSMGARPSTDSTAMFTARGDHFSRLIAVSTSPTGTLVLTIYQEGVRLPNNGIAAWSPASSMFACTGEDYRISVWETRTGQVISTFGGHFREVTAVVFNRDEQWVLSASQDGTIRRWKVRHDAPETNHEVVFRDEGGIDAFTISSDGRWMLSASAWSSKPPATSSTELLAKPNRPPVTYNGSFCALRLHDATGRVVWMENHHCMLRSLAFSEDSTRALAGNVRSQVFWYDLAQLTARNSAVSRPLDLAVVPEHQFGSLSTRWVEHVSFSPDGGGIVTESDYIPLRREEQPARIQAADQALLPAYFIDDDGWLTRAGEQMDARRICWVPPSFRPKEDDIARSWSVQGHAIALKTRENHLVVLDASCGT
ncbi:hypothetical protein BN946_scf184792.g2 [Trametes cinnabarina]|uniref:Nephrocystin 3-like N-terminal domain-containing protein n=1 Tax=Pycnoporus cinnabarinus TaxID=5643 RepID=A0A060SN20_PYCCI|nr:hypothetical protein BN946_scf184792.g2 [Trametes cinnabarina]